MTDATQYETISINSEADRKMLKGFIEEAVLHKRTQAAASADIKDIRTEAKDKLGIPPKIFGRLVRAAYKDAFTEERREYEEFEGLVEVLYPQD